MCVIDDLCVALAPDDKSRTWAERIFCIDHCKQKVSSTCICIDTDTDEGKLTYKKHTIQVKSKMFVVKEPTVEGFVREIPCRQFCLYIPARHYTRDEPTVLPVPILPP
jgi:hypothetical protein